MAKGKYRQWLEPDGLLLLESWARDGLSDLQICKNIGISDTTYYVWQNTYPAIREAIKKGKAPVDIEVENALLKSALGYTVKITKPIKVKTRKQKPGVGTIEEEQIQYADEEIYIAPQVAAQVFWLKNRRPDKWKDKPGQLLVEARQSDNFLDALSGTAKADWEEEADGD